jgi:hypothetical protein
MPAGVPFFTKDNALEFARAGAYARWHRPKPEPKPVPEPEPVALRIAHAIELCLDQLEDPDTPAKDRQALATSLRSLRETYHMVTGDALPGRLKPQSDRRTARPAPAQPIG